jgi:hypothetical protein
MTIGRLSETDLGATLPSMVGTNESNGTICGPFVGDSTLPCRDLGGGGGAFCLSSFLASLNLAAVYAVIGVFISVDSADSRLESVWPSCEGGWDVDGSDIPKEGKVKELRDDCSLSAGLATPFIKRLAKESTSIFRAG